MSNVIKQKLTFKQITRAMIDGREIIEQRMRGTTALNLMRTFQAIEKHYQVFEKTRDQLTQTLNIADLEKGYIELKQKLSGKEKPSPVQQKKFTECSEKYNAARTAFQKEINEILNQQVDIETLSISEEEIQKLDVSAKCLLAIEPFITKPPTEQ